MANETLGAALEREHREIDEGFDAFTAGLALGEVRKEPLHNAIEALRRHIYLEEEFLFPSLRAAGMVAPVFVMLREHGEIWRLLEQLEAAIEAGPVGEPVLGLCRQLAAALETHNMKEEHILYPRADGVLEETENAKLVEFLSAGRMPGDWACAQA
ncbi:MAG: hemerythrin domain-containing protein [Dehalococcoidia bacterium]|nr:hemerythrin domain-containing protein [Dehalococcoidia bacterium]